MLFINAAEEFDKGKRQNALSPAHIHKIIDTYQKRPAQIERYARCVSLDELQQNNYNLNISRYVSTAKPEEKIDLKATHKELATLEKTIKQTTKTHNKFLKELGLPLLDV